MIYKKFLFLILIIANLISIKAITIKALVFTFTEKAFIYNPLVNAFNKYSIDNELDIDLQLTLLTPQNATSEIYNYGSAIYNLLQKKSDKYDIYFYYGSYSEKIGHHLVNLSEYISNDHIEMYDSHILEKNCSSNKKIVGLPISIDISVLYSNNLLLSKYGKTVPKTWDQLIETGSYILQKEREQNNNALIGYNGLFNDVNGGVSIYEFIHSFRESNSAPHPEIMSKTTIKALETLKKLKNEISSGNTISIYNEKI
ncbi:hypothetical protein PIROE2DRAFT_1202 [Piromyces sp. E2]|nr:hypothetical protein PIROE2DRAFT_1202 [Piromyces sp. E2]|eukprot:OUM70662.1 hypothetical protein PIROE2DRAFT_1202 [Piromyces sp. E2]